MHLRSVLLKFLQKHRDPSTRVLLALSGGPDSLVLFDLLKEENIAVAHVDHGWRKESGGEADCLKEMACDIPFHTTKIPYSSSEEVCRQERLKFFKRVCDENGYQAVILGHHNDDQAETVLKRVLEGAALENQGGMKEVTLIEGLTLWRPLLIVSKNQIWDWIKARDLHPFIDSTNEDPKYLRAKMRREIIPELSSSFGKQVKNSLIHLGEEVKEMKAFLKGHLSLYTNKIEVSHSGSFLDLSDGFPETPFELKHILRIVNPALARKQLATAANFILTGAANKKVGKLYIDRRRLFLPAFDSSPLEGEIVPLESSMKYGAWEILTEPAMSPKQETVNWKHVWNGKTSVILPKESYMIGPSNKTRNNEKVPNFLKNSTPVIFLNGEIQHEFLTGKINHKATMNKEWMRIILTRGKIVEKICDMCYNEMYKEV